MNELATKLPDIQLPETQEGQVPLVRQTEDFSPGVRSIINAMFARGDNIKDIIGFIDAMRRDQQRIAFEMAMADAAAELPVIEKNRLVFYEHKDKTGKTSYRHADLAEIHRTYKPILARYGLHYRYKVSNGLNEPVQVTCILSHRDGHEEQNTLMGGADTSGQKNSLQAMMSTITYLQRYTLLPLVGGSAGEDNDGGDADKVKVVQYISRDQADELTKLIEGKGRTVEKFCTHQKISDILHVKEEDFEKTVKWVKTWKPAPLPGTAKEGT